QARCNQLPRGSSICGTKSIMSPTTVKGVGRFSHGTQVPPDLPCRHFFPANFARFSRHRCRFSAFRTTRKKTLTGRVGALWFHGQTPLPLAAKRPGGNLRSINWRRCRPYRHLGDGGVQVTRALGVRTLEARALPETSP